MGNLDGLYDLTLKVSSSDFFSASSMKGIASSFAFSMQMHRLKQSSDAIKQGGNFTHAIPQELFQANFAFTEFQNVVAKILALDPLFLSQIFYSIFLPTFRMLFWSPETLGSSLEDAGKEIDAISNHPKKGRVAKMKLDLFYTPVFLAQVIQKN